MAKKKTELEKLTEQATELGIDLDANETVADLKAKIAAHELKEDEAAEQRKLSPEEQAERDEWKAERRRDQVAHLAGFITVDMADAKAAAGMPTGRLTNPEDRAAILAAAAKLRVDMAVAIIAESQSR